MASHPCLATGCVARAAMSVLRAFTACPTYATSRDLGVRSMTFGLAHLHAVMAHLIDYLCVDPQISAGGMLRNRGRSPAGYRVAGKYLAIIQPFSALLASSAQQAACTHREASWAWKALRCSFDPASLCSKALRYQHLAALIFLQWSDGHHEPETCHD